MILVYEISGYRNPSPQQRLHYSLAQQTVRKFITDGLASIIHQTSTVQEQWTCSEAQMDNEQ
jgi:hypothetical protein